MLCVVWLLWTVMFLRGQVSKRWGNPADTSCGNHSQLLLQWPRTSAHMGNSESTCTQTHNIRIIQWCCMFSPADNMSWMLWMTASFFSKVIPVIRIDLPRFEHGHLVLSVFWKPLPVVDFKHDQAYKMWTSEQQPSYFKKWFDSHGSFQVQVCVLVFWMWFSHNKL